MERFATRLFEPDAKVARVRDLGIELSNTRQRWVAGLIDLCPTFETVYGRTPESFLRTLKDRTDCVLSKTYVNSVAMCLRQVCGNGIVEDPEQCDDGNSNDGDACHNDCTRGS